MLGTAHGSTLHASDMRRTPPPVTPVAALLPPNVTCDSDTSDRSGGSATSARPKRKREHNDELHEFKSEMKGMVTRLSNTVEQRFNEVIQQNTEVQKTLQFMSDQYDSVLEKLKNFDVDRAKDRRHIQALEDKIESLERKIKSTGLEVRNIPRVSTEDKGQETKEQMCSLVKSLAKSVDVELKDSDIKDVYRINSSKEAMKPLIVELNSVMKKESVVKAVKDFNRDRTKGDKLNSSHLKIPGPPRPVYVSETLTFYTQKLFFMAREFARENQYSYCWTSRGFIYLRKTDGQSLIRVSTEADLQKLKSA